MAEPNIIPDTPGVDFFIGELANMQQSFERRFNVQAERLRALEEKNKGQYDDDPMRSILPFVIVIVALQFLPLLGDMVAKWRLSSSSEL